MKFFGSDFKCCTISLLVLLKYLDFVKTFFMGPLTQRECTMHDTFHLVFLRISWSIN
jgi:hypothetical protein